MDSVFQHESKSKGTRVWKRIKNMLLFSSFLGLVSLNIATLVSDSLHTVAFNVLGSALVPLGPGLTAEILRSAPVVKRKYDVEVATQEQRDKYMRLEKRYERLKRSHTKLNTNHKKLEASHTEISKKHNMLKIKSARKAEAVQKASRRMANRTVVGARRNIASLPGESIPLIGTALIVGVTAWDIYDSCENLKDLNELNDVFKHHREDQTQVCGIKVPTKEWVTAKARENWREAYEAAANEINKAAKFTQSHIERIEVTVPKTPSIMTWEEIEERYDDSVKLIEDWFMR